MLKISILTPIYGVEKYIEQCVRSLFEQSYASIEYIFVDDCTPDKSIGILQSLLKEYPERAQQVRIIHHDRNRGVGAARQTALMAATGDYLLFADSDDMLPEDAVEKLTTKAESTHADLVDGGYREWCDEKAGRLQKPFDVSDEQLLKLLVCQNIITNRLWGRIYKRSLIMEHRIFFEEGINYAEDLFWNAQFMFYGKKVNIDDAVYYYRTDNENSYNHNISEKNLLSYFKSTRRLIDFFHQPCLTSLSRFVFLSFFISSFGIAQNGYMMKNMMNKEITIVNFMALISSNVVGLVLAFNGMAYWSLAWQQVIFILVLNIGRYYYTGWRPNFHIDFGPVRKMFGFSVKLLVTNIINTVSNNVLTFVFGRFYPINDVGNYSQAYNWDTKANSFVANTVGQIAQPVLASIQNDKNRELLVFRKMLRFTAFLSFPLMFGLTLVSREFILITIHEKWIASVPLLQILCVSGAFMPIYTLYQNLAISKGRSDVYMWCNIGQVVGLLALVLFCHQYGIQTMVIAYTLFIIAWLLVWQWMMKRVAGLRFLDVAKDILPFMLCAAATMVVTYFMTRSLQNIYLLLLVRLLVSAIIYFCIMKLLKVQILEECIAFCKRGR